MNTFETIVIFEKDPTDINLREYLDIFQHYSAQYNKNIKMDKIGIKKLAYEIKGCKEGYYIIFYYKATSEAIADIQDKLNKDRNVLKFLITKPDGIDLPDLKPDQKSEQMVKTPVDVFDLIFGID